MSTLNFTRIILRCDGCLKRHGDPHGHGSAREARVAAYIDGWRFPSTARADGSPGSGSSDVCPDCLPTWEPQGYLARPSRSRRLRVDESPRPTSESSP
ncbi:hypothetical protein GCM10011583_57700 [Streptomyces camponoticapitis]|uniref:Uncharacterized protein n=1 Tax=Streptomyces camponoticapitis TaxID=1616125 RepID=A0ABQ2ENR5_9ACTN|nr:hypothetical protein [Streptomyces camponoticapitis]GGK18281.1 hypothetical protein GCM10011583_57700 [Streptomyces camponoticapitis]